MTKWANPNILTNYTVGFFILFALAGMTAGEAMTIFIRRVLKKDMDKRRLVLWQAGSALMGSLLFATLMDLAGVIPGGRF